MSLLQSWTGSNTGGSTSIAAAPGTNLSSGSKIIIVVPDDANASNPITSIDDGHSNTAGQVDHYDWSLTGRYDVTDIWVMDTPAGDVGTKPTFTIHFTSTTTSTAVFMEVSGLATGQTSAILDGSPGHSTGSNSGVSSPFGPPSYASSASGEFLIYIVGDPFDGLTTWSGPAGYTIISDDANGASDGSVMVGYKNSTGSTETGAWSWTGGASYHGSLTLVAFKLAGGNASVSPGALAATAVLPAPSISLSSINASVSVPALAATTQLPALGAVAKAAVTVTALAATTQFPATTVFDAINIDALAATAVLPAPTIQTGTISNASVSVPALTATTQIPAPAVVANAIVAVTALAATVALPAPTIQTGAITNATVNPAALAATSVLPAPVVAALAAVVAPALAATTQLPAPAETANATITVGVLAVTIQLPAPSIQTGLISNASVSVSVLAVTCQFAAPTVVDSPAVSSAALAATVQLPAPAVKAYVVVAVQAVAVTVQLPSITPPFTIGFLAASIAAQSTVTASVAAQSTVTASVAAQDATTEGTGD